MTAELLMLTLAAPSFLTWCLCLGATGRGFLSQEDVSSRLAATETLNTQSVEGAGLGAGAALIGGFTHRGD